MSEALPQKSPLLVKKAPPRESTSPCKMSLLPKNFCIRTRIAYSKFIFILGPKKHFLIPPPPPPELSITNFVTNSLKINLIQQDNISRQSFKDYLPTLEKFEFYLV